MNRSKTILIACGGLVLATFTYVSALGLFINWEERASTKSEFIRRVKVRNSVYAPVIWLKAHDPTGVVRAVVQWQYRLSHDPSFDSNSLPMK
jgi:hypothetical protein